MRSLSQRASTALAAICVTFVVLIAATGIIGIAGVNSATRGGNSIAGDELTTSTTTAQLIHSMDAVYVAGEEALGSSSPVIRLAMTTSLYSSLLPTVDAQLETLERLHALDTTAEFKDIQLFARQWKTVRNLLSPSSTLGGVRTTTPAELATAFQPLSAHFNRLILTEQSDGSRDLASASSSGDRATDLLAGAVGFAVLIAVLLFWFGTRRVRRIVEPQQEQLDFADTLQIAGDEDEAHLLLKRHLERVMTTATAVVLNRNNSADRLEAVTPVPDDSQLCETLRGAEPRSCLAVRSGRVHHEDARHPGLLSCAVCSGCAGSSVCTPLTVGGEVIGSVLLNRSSPFAEVEEQSVRESVSQAAPVLANLRNLAVAEIRAATDGLTGLPNKRAVTDTMKRMFAQASRTGAPLILVLLDLDHFKLINDRLGHPVGDQVLANVGSILHGALRPGDFAGRNGGEEFAILLPDTSQTTGSQVAERIRLAIADITIPGVDVSVTVSLGVAAYPDHANTPERLERLADAALYLAKRQGRNRTEIADPTHESATDVVLSHGAEPEVEVTTKDAFVVRERSIA
jgi:diguanylate cyclase (GGDEF)-like protein